MELYHEPAKEIPVKGHYDIIVAGGGPSGFTAGIAASRQGANVLIIEKQNCLGGNLTAGMMNQIWSCNDKEKLVINGIAMEYCRKVDKLGGMIPCDFEKDAFYVHDAEIGKYVVSEMAQAEAHLEVLYNTMVCDVIMGSNKIDGLIIENKSGRQAVFAKIIIDASGDADVVAKSGAEFYTIAPSKRHPVTLEAKMCNVNIEELLKYYETHPVGVAPFRTDWKIPGFHCYGITDEFDHINIPEELQYLKNWFVCFFTTPNKNELHLNITGDIDVDGTNAESISKAEYNSRKRVMQCVELFKLGLPGCKDAYLAATAAILGIRESRQIKGLYTLKEEDLLQCRRFDDAIYSFSGPVGVHTPDGEDSKFLQMAPGTSYDVPYRCIVPVKMDGLLVAGRTLDADHGAMGTVRVMSSCMAMGEAAGIAASICIKENIQPREVDTKELQKKIIEAGGIIVGINA